MITFTIALHGKHAWECWWKIVTATTASAMGGATDNPRDWEDAIAPPRQGRGRAFKAISLECCHHWALSSAYLSRSLGGSYMGTRSAQGTFVANLPL
jgi:hypothetical protein